jgi:hypothetical protein
LTLNVAESELRPLEELLRPLAENTRAEFLAELRKLSLHQDDDELLKLLKILSLYAAFYETIPAAISEVHGRAIVKIEALLQEPASNPGSPYDERVAQLLDQLASSIEGLRNLSPPPFEEFRATMENIHTNAANVSRYSRDLIVELQKNVALARRGWTASDGVFIFTASGSAVIGAVAVHVLMRFFHL